jgi:hypothetical protein
MKKIYLIITILFVSICSCKAQTIQLTGTEFYNIKVNNNTLRSIYDTNADVTKMKALFGSDLLYKYENDILIYKEFWNHNYSFSFGEDDNLDYFKVHSSSITVIVKGITVKLGDKVSVFGNSIVINTYNGDNSVVFVSELSSSIAFKIDKITNKIIEIEFNAF